MRDGVIKAGKHGVGGALYVNRNTHGFDLKWKRLQNFLKLHQMYFLSSRWGLRSPGELNHVTIASVAI